MYNTKIDRSDRSSKSDNLYRSQNFASISTTFPILQNVSWLLHFPRCPLAVVRPALALASVRAMMDHVDALAHRGHACVVGIASAPVALAARVGFQRKLAAVGASVQVRSNAVGRARVVRRAIVRARAGAGAVVCAPATNKGHPIGSSVCFRF
jgi:hypothetical protein